MSYISADQVFRQASLLRQNGRLAEAASICRSTIYNFPNDIRILNLIAILDLQQGMARDSLGWMERSLALESRQPEVWSNYATALEQQGRLAEALKAVDKAIALKPDYADAYANRANFLNLLGRPAEGLAACEEAMRRGAKSVAVYVNRGNALRNLMRFDEALVDFDRALKMAPDAMIVVNNRGHLLKDIGRPEESVAAFDQVIKSNPYFADGYVGRANALYDLRRYEECIRDYDTALTLAPDSADAKWNKAMVCLLTEDFDTGWALMEARWKGSVLSKAVRHFPQPELRDDTDVAGKTVLVYGEQGFGDTVQFSRYVPMLEARGAKVVFDVPAALKNLISTMPGEFRLFATGEDLPDADYQSALMSLPYIFHTRLESIPGETPYLSADPAKRAVWAEKLGQKKRPRVGLCWSGSSGRAPDYARSMPAKYLAPLMDLPVEFHCMQKEIRPKDAEAIAGWPITTHADELGNFADTAALMAHMDVVISVDTSVAHVAAATGRPVWLTIPWANEWRWLRERADSPWYPTMTFFRQPKWGDWDSIIAAIGERLKAL